MRWQIARDSNDWPTRTTAFTARRHGSQGTLRALVNNASTGQPGRVVDHSAVGKLTLASRRHQEEIEAAKRRDCRKLRELKLATQSEDPPKARSRAYLTSRLRRRSYGSTPLLTRVIDVPGRAQCEAGRTPRGVVRTHINTTPSGHRTRDPAAQHRPAVFRAGQLGQAKPTDSWLNR